MNSYIYRVAKQFYNHFDLEISKFTFVFPNRRAGIFFQRYISDIANKPLFSPEILTIDECFLASTKLKVADKTEMLFILYDMYLKISGSSDKFDTFIYWGEVLLSDFNEVDKYLIDTNQLFRNITEWKEIDYSGDYLTENQIDTIKQFWSSFTIYQSENRENFLQIWQVLQNLYQEFKQELKNQGCGYEGMIFRDVVENLNENKSTAWFEGRNFVFIGFNALNPSEKKLMTYLHKQQKADFYWDYEAEILRDPNNPASEFYMTNTTLFPSSMVIEAVNESFAEKSFNLVTVSSGIGQARYIYHILSSALQKDGNSEQLLSTAVILPDENLLIPVLQSIPGDYKRINVTMGFPLELTPIAGLIQLIFELCRKTRMEGHQILFHHRCAKNILNHQLIVLLTGKAATKVLRLIREQNLIYSSEKIYVEDKLLELIFRDVNSENFTDYLINILTEIDHRLKLNKDFLTGFELESSFIYQYYVTVKRFAELLHKYSNQLSVSIDTLISIITGLCSGISVPFVGEPLNGLQIMGVLEARGLDFENIIIPSFNEGVFPGRSFEISYIPYHLRKGFGLPTYELNDSIVSYNFYRLLNRARNIYFISDNRSESGNSGEVSRFLYQLKYQYQAEIKEIKPVFDISVVNSSALQVKKDDRIVDIMKQFVGENPESKAFSASSLNDYLDCPLRFYFKYIANLNKEDEISELVESDVFGNIFHFCMAEIYAPYKQKIVNSNDIEKIIGNDVLIRATIYKAFHIYFYKNQSTPVNDLDGNNLLISNIVYKYITRVLEYDQTIAPFRFIGSEISVKGTIETKYGKINLKGNIDRVDEAENIIRIIDYKTGKGELSFKGLDKVFESDVENATRYPFALQIFLYALLFHHKSNAGQKIQPGIYYMKNIFSNDFDWKLKDLSVGIVEDFDNYIDIYSERLVELVENIFNLNIPFYQTNQLKNCEYCDFKILCNR